MINPLDPTAMEPTFDMTTRAQEVVMEQNQPIPPAEENNDPATKEKKKLWSEFKSRVEACKSYRRKLVSTWTQNIDMRRGKPFASQSDEDRINVPVDWSLTKTKQASLFSQVPKARITHTPETNQYPWVLGVETKCNDTLILAGIESAMDEVLPDVINAAGIGAILVSYEAIMQNKDVPAVDPATIPPEFQQEFLQNHTIGGEPVPMESVPTPVDHRYCVTRISPADLLWPINFFGSDFNNAPWIGRSGRISWPQAVQRFGLTEADKEKCLGDDRTVLDKLNHDQEKDRIIPDEMVSFDEIFYKEYEYHIESESYSTIHHLIFVEGKQEPVVDEQWQGQRFDEEKGLIGASKFPIQVLTLAYISDETIPPSDTAMGRPQANELNKSRSQMIQQRDRNIPVRWMNINRVDPTIQTQLMRGTWSGIIPVNGRGDDVLGEVAKSTMPQEDFTFDQIAKADLAEVWSLGPNQLGSGAGVETKGEGDTIQSNFQTRLGRERAKVAKFFCSIAEILTGLLCLYEDPASFGEGFDPSITKTLSYSILSDSTVLLDANQRLERIINFTNFAGKSGFLNLEPVLKEAAQLTGLDPNVIQPPQPKPPVEPSISLRLTGGEDLTNPLVLAFLLKSGQAPEPELIEQAKQLLSMVVVPKAPPVPPTVVMNADGSHEVVNEPQAEAKAPVLENMQLTIDPVPQAGPEGQGGMVDPMGNPIGQPPLPAPPQVGQANPQWGLMDRINRREEEGQG